MEQKSTAKDDLVRAHVWVKGRVQGVGFRAHVEYGARQIGGLKGWVRNVGWKTVEATVEGESEKVDRFIEMMKQGPSVSRVDECTVEWEDVTGEFREFGVKRSS
jgi:acylphosphatase